MRPGISTSASSSSLRPNTASSIDATLLSGALDRYSMVHCAYALLVPTTAMVEEGGKGQRVTEAREGRAETLRSQVGEEEGRRVMESV